MAISTSIDVTINDMLMHAIQNKIAEIIDSEIEKATANIRGEIAKATPTIASNVLQMFCVDSNETEIAIRFRKK